MKRSLRRSIVLLLGLLAWPALASAQIWGAGRPIACGNWTAINQTSSTKIITGKAGLRTFVCAIHLVTVNNVALVGGTGSTCGTGTSGLAGGTTAATGWLISTNPVLNIGDGFAAIMADTTAGDDICLLQSGNNQVSGAINWQQLP